MKEIDKELFAHILDKDEFIIKTFRPNKKRYCIVNIIISMILIAIVGFGLISGGIIGYYIMGADDLQVLLPLILSGLAIIVILVIYIVYILITYKKTIYAISNKRLMIRTGFIGVDYKALDMNMIGSFNVKVGLLDRFIKPAATGTLYFGSTSSPMMLNSKNIKTSQFVLDCIDNPYEIYRDIKEMIDESKKALY